MPTEHRRIAIIRDQRVERALAEARDALDSRDADASLARELIVRGAEAVRINSAAKDEWGRTLAEKYGARPANRRFADALDEIVPIPLDPEDPYRASRILDELREDTV